MTECPGATGASAGPRPHAPTGPRCFDDMREIVLKGLLQAHQGRAHTPENLRRGVCPLKNLEDPWNISSFQPFEDGSLTRRDPLDSCSGVTECAVLNTQIMIQMNLSGPHHTGCKNKQIKWADCIPNCDTADTFEGFLRL